MLSPVLPEPVPGVILAENWNWRAAEMAKGKDGIQPSPFSLPLQAWEAFGHPSSITGLVWGKTPYSLTSGRLTPSSAALGCFYPPSVTLHVPKPFSLHLPCGLFFFFPGSCKIHLFNIKRPGLIYFIAFISKQ